MASTVTCRGLADLQFIIHVIYHYIIHRHVHTVLLVQSSKFGMLIISLYYSINQSFTLYAV